jgi:hypothetical protein
MLKSTPLARLTIILFVLAACRSAYAGESRDVSIIQLIATPEQFNGQEVRFIGFLHLEFEGDAVYLHRDDYENSILRNSVAIELSGSERHAWRKLNNHYVVIEGRFSSVAKGHLSARSGSVQHITRLSNWSVRRTRSKPSEQ